MAFSRPLALLLLLLLPVIAWLGWPSRSTSRGRERLSLALRLVINLCLILALAGFTLVQPSRRLAVMFLLDVSDSMPETAVNSGINYIRKAMQSMGPDDQAGVIVFGGDALVEQALSNRRDLPGILSVPHTGQTDIAEAIRLALALYPPGSARRIVLLTDGEDTVSAGSLGSSQQAPLQQAARMAQSAGAELVIVPYQVQRGAEVWVSRVDTPEHLRQGEQFNLDLTLEANRAGPAQVRIYAGDQLVYDQSHDLEPGSQTFSLPLTAGDPGFVRYRVQITSPEDSFFQNNQAGAYSLVEGPPRLLVITPPPGEPMGLRGDTRPDESSVLVQALQAAGMLVEQAAPSGLPSSLPSLAEYASVLLVDVPARDLNPDQLSALQTYVRDLGGGLVAVGGPTSYGVGGYFRTPLEEILPVEMQIKDQQRRPSLGLVFIIDHSGSMDMTSGGVAKLELAKEAAIRSIDLLMPSDRVGVIAFDESASWVVPMTDLSDPQAIKNRIATIRSGGGTDILSGLVAMSKVLPGDPAKVKHVILLTDGGADPTGIPELVKKLYDENGITLTTVGVGTDAAPYLKDLAADGGGRYHFAANPASIPSIFTEETTLATRSYLIEETFYPKVQSRSPILAGITETPPLYGYVGTGPKTAAQTILVSDKGDPVLAAWQYGLGRSVAWTSDATGRWAKDWLNWPGFPTFWAQAVRYTIGDTRLSPVQVSVENQGKQSRLVVDAFQPGEAGDQAAYLNNYNMQANLIAPDGTSQAVSLSQVGPGRYAADFSPDQEGVYLIRLSGTPQDSNESPISSISGWVNSYSPEYRLNTGGLDNLLRIAASVSGKVASENPSDVFKHDLPVSVSRLPAWNWLLLLAALLLPVDIAVRRLALTRADLARWAAKARAALKRRPALPAVRVRDERLAALKEAKQRAQDEMQAEPKPAQPEPVMPRKTTLAAGLVKPEAENKPEPAVVAGRQKQSTTSTLLQKKREKKDKGE